MAIQQVRDILGEVAGFHRRLSGLYQQAADASRKERIRMLYSYLGRHESRLEQALIRFGASGSPSVLNTGISMKTMEHLLESMKSIELSPDLGPEDLVTRALQFDNLVVEMYRLLADRAPDSTVRQFFLNLLKREQRAEATLARDTEELSDL